MPARRSERQGKEDKLRRNDPAINQPTPRYTHIRPCIITIKTPWNNQFPNHIRTCPHHSNTKTTRIHHLRRCDRSTTTTHNRSASRVWRACTLSLCRYYPHQIACLVTFLVHLVRNKYHYGTLRKLNSLRDYIRIFLRYNAQLCDCKDLKVIT